MLKSTSSRGFGTYPFGVSDDQRLEELERRVAALEEFVVRSSSFVERAPKPLPTTNYEPRTRIDVALVGRSLIAMGGAYLLRAVTDHGSAVRRATCAIERALSCDT